MILTMLISSPCVVSLTWRLQDTLGNVIDELVDPVEFFVGGDDLLAAVEEAILDEEAGFQAQLQLEPEQAFGDYLPELVFFEARSLFPEHIEPGMQFDGPPEGCATEGLDPEAVYTITEIYPEHVVLDGNHPLAGIALRLDLTVRSVRAATESEVEASSVDQPAALTVLNALPPSPHTH
ncbi:MAG: peptidylprolyl isomerase [Pseudomonadota bacterium]|jgi:FKBP-type peptidyl-prolyl cis-trans isomerase SlyD